VGQEPPEEPDPSPDPEPPEEPDAEVESSVGDGPPEEESPPEDDDPESPEDPEVPEPDNEESELPEVDVAAAAVSTTVSVASSEPRRDSPPLVPEP